LQALIDELDPTTKYQTWILKQLKFQNILPEDKDRVVRTLKTFHKLSGTHGLETDINKYKRFHELEELTDKLLGIEVKSRRQEEEEIKSAGIVDYREDGNWKIVEVTTPEAAVLVSEKTKWCTSDTSKARSYL